MVEITTMGPDIAKQIFQVHAVSSDGRTLVKRQLRRSEVLRYFGKLPRRLVGIAACGGSHFLGARDHSARP